MHSSEQEVSALKGKADLVTQVVAKYGLEQAQAQREVDAVLKGPPDRRQRLGRSQLPEAASAFPSTTKASKRNATRRRCGV